MIYLNLTHENRMIEVRCDPQRTWIKIEVACERNATECYRDLRQVCGNETLPE